MKPLDWNPEKNIKLMLEREISFEDIQVAIEDGNLLGVFPHPDTKKYPNQQLFLVLLGEYVYAVPFLEKEDCYFLKTGYPSRKYTKHFLREVTRNANPEDVL